MKLLLALLVCFQPPQIFNATGVYSQPTSQVAATLQLTKVKRLQKKYLAMFTASFCGPCQSWKNSTKKRLEAQGYEIVEYEMTLSRYKQKFGKKVKSYPTFAVIDRESGEWLSGPISGGISEQTAISLLSTTVATISTTSVVQEAPKATFSAPMPNRYIQWPGWGTIDLETYNRNCNCSMCVSIRAMQQEYWKQKHSAQGPQTQIKPIPPDQQGCPDAIVEAMLSAIPINSMDVLVDLGCGDGRVVIAAAKRGIKSIGIEIDPARAEVARKNVTAAGVSHLVTIETGDALLFDMKRATIATAFLYPPLLEKLSPKLKQARVVASPFHPIPGLAMSQVGDVWVSVN